MEKMDGKELAKTIRAELKEEVENLKKNRIHPKLAVIMVGEDKASAVYVRNKSKACNEVGVEYEEFLLPTETTMDKLLGLIETLNQDTNIDGILLQSPIPKHLDIDEAFRAIDPGKDVDGFHPVNVGKLSLNQDCFVSCTPFGIIKMLETYHVPIEGKHAVIIGRSNIVGKPLIQCLLNKNATVTICHSKTQNLEEVTKQADILIAAIGATIGYTWIVDTESPFYYKDGNLIILSVKDGVNSSFLNYVLGILIADFKNKDAAGSAQLALTIEKLEKMQVVSPDIELQNQFAIFVRKVEKLKSTTQQSIDELQLLFDSLMQKYFG